MFNVREAARVRGLEGAPQLNGSGLFLVGLALFASLSSLVLFWGLLRPYLFGHVDI